MIDTDFYAKLDGLTTAPVQQNVLSDNQPQPFVWFQRQYANTDLLLNAGAALYDTTYDVEVCGLDIDATAAIAENLKTSLHGFHGTMGGTNVLGMFVQDADDNYVQKNMNADEGFHVFAFQVQIMA